MAESPVAPPAPASEIIQLFFNDLTDAEVENLIGVVGQLDPYEMVNENSAARWSAEEQFVIERFVNLIERLAAAKLLRVEAELEAEFGSEEVIDIV